MKDSSTTATGFHPFAVVICRLLFLLTAITIVVSVAVSDFDAAKNKYWDLEFRLSGARLLNQGYNPYFLLKKKDTSLKSDSLPCCNLPKRIAITPTASTAPPFVHYLLIPLSYLPLQQAGLLWTGILYFMMLLLTIMAIKTATNSNQVAVVITCSLLCLLTPAWNHQSAAGQIYITMPLLCMLFMYIFTRVQSTQSAMIAGSIAIIIFLIRPNTLVFFPLFLFLQKKWTRRNLISFYAAIIVICLLVFMPTSQISLWKSYQKNLTEQILFHQRPTVVQNAHNKNTLSTDSKMTSKKNGLESSDCENGNFFAVYEQFFHKKIPLNILYLLTQLAVFSIALVFYLYHRKENSFTIENISFASYSLYMTTDLFSPVYRHQYYTVQWLFPLLLAAALYSEIKKIPLLLLAAGLFLNVTTIRSIPMRHTIGEYLFLLACLLLSLSKYKSEIRPGQLNPMTKNWHFANFCQG
jgi:Glycosyltransferase family 87